MAARKKTPARKAAPKRKAPKRAPQRKTVKRKAAPPPRSAHRELPNDDAWRELVETAVEKPDPNVSAVSIRGKSK
jgi:hypothetical protein